MKTTGLRAGEETDRTIWRRKISNHTGDPTRWEKQEEKKKIVQALFDDFTHYFHRRLINFCRGATIGTK